MRRVGTLGTVVWRSSNNGRAGRGKRSRNDDCRMALPFEQQSGESNKAFAAFSLYLSMGPQRSLGDVERKLGKSHTVISRWSAKWEWTARVAAYGAHMGMVEREAAEAMLRAKG